MWGVFPARNRILGAGGRRLRRQGACIPGSGERRRDTIAVCAVPPSPRGVAGARGPFFVPPPRGGVFSAARGNPRETGGKKNPLFFKTFGGGGGEPPVSG